MEQRFKHNPYPPEEDRVDSNGVIADDLQSMKPVYTRYITKAAAMPNGTIQIEMKETLGKDLKNANVRVIKSHEKAMEKYYYCISKLREIFPEICELPEGWEYGLTTYGVVFDYIGSEMIMGAEIHAIKQLKLSGTTMKLISPFKLSSSNKKKDNPATVLPEAAVVLLEQLIEASLGYIDGDRAQPSLAEQGDDTELAVVPTGIITTTPKKSNVIAHESVKLSE